MAEIQEQPPYVMLGLGLVCLFGGVIVDLATHPIQPISYVPGLIFFPFAIGVGLALLERWQKVVAIVAYYLALVWLLVSVGLAATSILPVCLLIAAYSLSRFTLWFYRPEPEKKRPIRRY